MSARLASAVGGLFVAVAAVGLAFTRLLHGSDWGGPSLNPTWTGRVAVVALIVAGCQVALYAFARARARRQRR